MLRTCRLEHATTTAFLLILCAARTGYAGTNSLAEQRPFARSIILSSGDIVESKSSQNVYKLREFIHAVGELSGSAGPVVLRASHPLAAGSRVCPASAPRLSPLTMETCEMDFNGVSRSHRRGTSTITPGEPLSSRNAEGSGYTIEDMIGHGAHGEVWRASRIVEGTEGESFVLKRIYHDRPAALLSGYREIHFGLLADLMAHPHIVRFVEHWQETQTDGLNNVTELWLVFKDEGTSLNRLLFQPVLPGSSLASRPALQGSMFWTRLRTERVGRRVVRKLIRSLVRGLHTLHQAGIMHRDIKSPNIMLGAQDGSMNTRIGDFGSAVDEYAMIHFYTMDGPSQDEETIDFAPPEVRFSSAPYDPVSPLSYDMFSLGIVILEVLLGKPASQLFQLEAREEALLRQQSRHLPENAVKDAILRRGMASLGICQASDPANVGCTFEVFAERVRKLDADAQAICQQGTVPERAYIPTISDGLSLVSAVDKALIAATSRFPSQSTLIQLFDQLALGWYDTADLPSAGLLPAPSAPGSHNNVHVHEPSLATPLLGSDGEDLLHRLLQWDPTKRLTSAEAMLHPFITRDERDE